MCECHHHTQHAGSMLSTTGFDFLAMGEWGIVLALFVTGFLGSFTHCIGMCGPFALSISEMRLMSLGRGKLQQRQKLKALFATPYYLGKAVTYTLLGALFYLASEILKNIPGINYVAFVLLSFVVAAFVMMGVNASVNLGGNLGLKFTWLIKVIEKQTKAIGSQFGIRGFATGMVLGLIPCGLVVASIAQAASYASNLPIMMLAVFAFGIATIPGLFLVALFGGVVLSSSSKKIFQILYALVMFYNAYILVVYALKLV